MQSQYLIAENAGPHSVRSLRSWKEFLLFPVFPWRHAGFFFEGTGEGKWILISAGERHAGDRDIRDGQKLPGVDDLG